MGSRHHKQRIDNYVPYYLSKVLLLLLSKFILRKYLPKDKTTLLQCTRHNNYGAKVERSLHRRPIVSTGAHRSSSGGGLADL